MEKISSFLVIIAMAASAGAYVPGPTAADLQSMKPADVKAAETSFTGAADKALPQPAGVAVYTTRDSYDMISQARAEMERTAANMNGAGLPVVASYAGVSPYGGYSFTIEYLPLLPIKTYVGRERFAFKTEAQAYLEKMEGVLRAAGLGLIRGKVAENTPNSDYVAKIEFASLLSVKTYQSNQRFTFKGEAQAALEGSLAVF